MKKDQEKLEKQLAETQAENRRLHDPLQKVSTCSSPPTGRWGGGGV